MFSWAAAIEDNVRLLQEEEAFGNDGRAGKEMLQITTGKKVNVPLVPPQLARDWACSSDPTSVR